MSPSEAAQAGYDSIERLGTGNCIWIDSSSEEETLREQQDLSGPIPGWFANLPFAGWLFSTDIVTDMTAKLLINPAVSNWPEEVALMRRALDSFGETAARVMVRYFSESSTWQTPTWCAYARSSWFDDPSTTTIRG